MKVKRFFMEGLHGSKKIVGGNFSPEITVVTGLNGSGKTSYLKTLWLVLSGNIGLAMRETKFSRIFLETDLFEMDLIVVATQTCEIELTINNDKKLYRDHQVEEDVWSNAEDEVSSEIRNLSSTLYFPTFRRIEGGFSIHKKSKPTSSLFSSPFGRAKGQLANALEEISNELSGPNHSFITSVSTMDVKSLTRKSHLDLHLSADQLQARTYAEIINQIKSYKNEDDLQHKSHADDLINSIQSSIEVVELERQLILSKIQRTQNIITSMYNHTGISISSTIVYGDPENAINSDYLSAGEKQLLGFICYNGFSEDNIIMIDEPELSLHVDWQRLLVPMFAAQKSSNQIVLASHSPFIYSQLPDSEIRMSNVRGDEVFSNG